VARGSNRLHTTVVDDNAQYKINLTEIYFVVCEIKPLELTRGSSDGQIPVEGSQFLMVNFTTPLLSQECAASKKDEPERIWEKQVVK
jgi:hypothetical protein